MTTKRFVHGNVLRSRPFRISSGFDGVYRIEDLADGLAEPIDGAVVEEYDRPHVGVVGLPRVSIPW